VPTHAPLKRSAPGGLISPEDRLRANLYDFLGLLLARPADAGVLGQTATLTGDASPLGQAIGELAALAARATPKAVAREFDRLFIGLGRGELLPYASFYLTGFLNEKPLAHLRRDMVTHGLARSETAFEPEDNIAALMESMGALITGRFGAPAGLEAQQSFFNRHIAPWARHFYSDLETAKSSIFYAVVGTVGRLFMDIEVEGFRLAAA